MIVALTIGFGVVCLFNILLFCFFINLFQKLSKDISFLSNIKVDINNQLNKEKEDIIKDFENKLPLDFTKKNMLKLTNCSLENIYKKDYENVIKRMKEAVREGRKEVTIPGAHEALNKLKISNLNLNDLRFYENICKDLSKRGFKVRLTDKSKQSKQSASYFALVGYNFGYEVHISWDEYDNIRDVIL